MGLLGNVCGALASGVFALSLTRYLGREGDKRDSQLKGALQELAGATYRGAPTELRLAFADRFGSDQCIDIVPFDEYTI